MCDGFRRVFERAKLYGGVSMRHPSGEWLFSNTVVIFPGSHKADRSPASQYRPVRSTDRSENDVFIRGNKRDFPLYHQNRGTGDSIS
ncbi:hypothetical protein KCP71_10315 [Salmonella enterica subsp. enterica]|nr:hypothetical protein KCP71_10315 [Salmonella enterica subsp. enterica]